MNEQPFYPAMRVSGPTALAMDTQWDAAVELASTGIPVFPCSQNKQPLVATGFKAASTDPGQIAAWAKQFPAALLGVPTGAASGLLVIDVDPDGQPWLAAHSADMQCGMVNHTRRTGGRHYIYKMPAALVIRNSASKIAAGVDVRAEGGYVIWWPANGNVSIGEIADIVGPPDWIIRAIQTPATHHAQSSVPGAVVERSRNDYLSREAFRMRKQGANAEQIYTVITALNSSRCTPPLLDAEVRGIADRKEKNVTDREAWPIPTPLPDGLPLVAAFDYELLPTLCRDFVADIAQRMQCPPDFVAVAVMVALSSLVGRRCCIAPKRADDWRVTPNLWGMVVSRPGTMKSPALKEAMSPLSVLSVRALSEFDHSQREMQAQSFLHEQLVNVTKDKMRKALKAGKRGEAGELAQDAIAIESGAPTCRRYIVNDCTVEKLGELLNENPNGLLCFRDELNGFFANLEKQGREADRAFYLECWNGDSAFTYDRIGRGTVHIEAACLSILGGIQPAPLAGILRGTNGAGDDGLLQRFQLAVWPDTGKDWQNIDRPPNEQARERMQRLAEQLDAMPMASEGQVLRFSDEAQALFDVWRESLELRLRSGTEHPTLEAHLSKYRKLVPALALLIHLTEQPGGPVQILALERAIAWAEYLETHARRIYSPAIAPDMDAALLLAKRIRKGEIGPRFTLRDIYRNGWSGLSTRDSAFAAVNVLLDFDWLRTTEETTSGRTRTAYEINPALLEDAQ